MSVTHLVLSLPRQDIEPEYPHHREPSSTGALHALKAYVYGQKASNDLSLMQLVAYSCMLKVCTQANQQALKLHSPSAELQELQL